MLIESIDLDDNSISSLDGLAYFWLPCLRQVNLKQNGISAIQPLHGCFSLNVLDLSHNQLIGKYICITYLLIGKYIYITYLHLNKADW